MKLWHVIPVIVIVGLVISGFGLLSADIADVYKYNTTAVNVTIFTKYSADEDVSSIVDPLGEDLDVSLDDEADDAEKSLLRRFGGVVSDLAGSFTTAKELFRNAENDLLIPGIVIGAFISILTVWFVVKVGGWAFNR